MSNITEQRDAQKVIIELWNEGDLDLLRQLNSPEMTIHFGGPETPNAEQKYEFIHAFPKINNPASNAICSKLGFAFVSECDFEYPVGHTIRCNDWRLRVGGSS